jgi:hypothetical protein
LWILCYGVSTEIKISVVIAIHEDLCRLRLKCAGTCAETIFRLAAKSTSPFQWGGGGRQFSRLLAAEVCVSAEVMLDTPRCVIV